jgi:hypothetical protein
VILFQITGTMPLGEGSFYGLTRSSAAVGGDLPEGRLRQLFAGHSLRAGLATAEIATSAGATASGST